MATNVVAMEIEGDHLLPTLKDAHERLAEVEGELILGFSSVRRIDAGGLRSIEELASLAEQKSVKLVLRGVNVDVYKVLKLANLASLSVLLD
jgi:anti-anti-sigma regulatory factor